MRARLDPAFVLGSVGVVVVVQLAAGVRHRIAAGHLAEEAVVVAHTHVRYAEEAASDAAAADRPLPLASL